MRYIDVAIKAAKEAEKIVMSYFNNEKEIKWKGEIDPVTIADIESEKKIISIIKENFPDHGIIAEEKGNEKENNEFVWIIDPIDGTTSFSHNYPMFSISIALYQKKEPITAVVLMPYMKELFTAEKGKGAFMNGNKIKVSDISEMKKALISTGFPYTRLSSSIDNLNYFNKVAKKAGELRRSGSAALDICYVACGRTEGYWEQGLKIMDSAAALLILKEAGGKASDFHGNPIKDNFTKIVATNNKMHDTLINLLKEAE